ncbi:PRA1 protein B3 [Datura stramonium]|uniref:PRA1 family protein n=1 Tax=Datura stramonium TaxID=4076 RepID=A0ABS8TFG4_DATST|nr:PRA1 protein B3 [Datura stramonium]
MAAVSSPTVLPISNPQTTVAAAADTQQTINGFSERETLGILIVSTVVVIFLTSVGSVLVSALMIGLAIVCTHAAFRAPEDLFLDEQESPANGLLSFLAPASGPAVSARV